ncbi:MAG: hypothetical protein KJN82_03485 [Bacteroidia bacterium]|nr:hypothetical protein [Bacteroidia bacterium]
MITSFFKSTKPFHFFLVILLSLFVFVFYRREVVFQDFNLTSLSINLLVYLTLLFTIAVQSFLVSKNNLTQKSSFSSILLVLFMAIIPATLIDNNVILSNFFIVLALRRLVSLKSNIAVKKKIFDAAFWIGIASLFYFWAILFFPLIFIALLIFSLGQPKNWIIPFVALIVIAICSVSYNLLVNNSFFFLENYFEPIGLSTINYNKITLVIGFTILVVLTIWSVMFYLKKLRELVRIKRTTYVVILYALFIAIAVIVVAPNKNGSEFIFLFTPLAIIATNYIEGLKDKWFGEFFIWLLVLTSLAILVLQFYAIS